MEHSIGYYIKAILDHVTPVIAILGALSLIGSAVFNLAYLITLDVRALFLMTLTDHISLSISIVPIVLVPLVIFGLIFTSYLIPFHAFSWIESKKALSRFHTFLYVASLIVVLTLGFLTIKTDLAVLLAIFYLTIATTPILGFFQRKPQWENKFLWCHAGLAVIYLFFFGRMLILSGNLRPLISVAILILILEIWALASTYRQSSTLLSLTVYLCHGLNLLLFLPLYSGYSSARADVSKDSTLARAEVVIRGGPTLKDMIVLRGMERGVLLWDGKRTVFVPWRNVVSMAEGTGKVQR